MVPSTLCRTICLSRGVGIYSPVMYANNQPARFLGPYPFTVTPIAVLTQRGTVRTRKRPDRWGQQYQAGGPASWIRQGFVTAGFHCIAGRCGHYAKVSLCDLPQDRLWREIGPRLLCEACGEVGAVSIEPHWHTNMQHAVPFSKNWSNKY